MRVSAGTALFVHNALDILHALHGFALRKTRAQR